MKRDIVVVGASAGGVEALVQVVGGLPADFGGSLFVVLHIPPTRTSVLPQILGRRAAVEVDSAVDGDIVRPGRVYVAPPDHHLVVGDGRVGTTQGPKDNGHRPSVDTLFRSAAAAYGRRVVGVVLSGAQSDGAPGLRDIKRQGGVAVVQDPEEAMYPSMPTHAMQAVDVDYVLALAGIAPQLVALARGDPPSGAGAGVSAVAPAPLR